MAGSYSHCVDSQGKLLINEQLQGMLECCSGDVYEAIEEMYGMIWYLASRSKMIHATGLDPEELVETARINYRHGLAMSPGVDGSNPQED